VWLVGVGGWTSRDSADDAEGQAREGGGDVKSKQ
jgi:hypothetical protein